MRACLIICALLLSACGRDAPARVIVAPSNIPADLLQGCAGWRGPTPATEGQWVDAAAAEMRGRKCANAKIAAIKQIASRKGGE